ncbi:hypothetical protein CPB83DRAFT_844027 [Crepidotus variabilis]|uniref:Uncharacterized protein n=1 Tax=Crepidotus variabilis TaxID=179855 RepID=A0A9P6ETE1_9AGAR|nr:hypothetical protein CPB83DRAFT_844027 [Crepidotus variabilis]
MPDQATVSSHDDNTRTSQTESLLDESIPPTDYSYFVTETLKEHKMIIPSEASSSSSSQQPSAIDQQVLRQCLNLASSFLVTDMTTNAETGMNTWASGLNSLVDLVIVLHHRHELEAETVSAASRACSECWTVAGNWRGFDECRERVREVGIKLKRILDDNERTYRGERIYAP